MNLRYCLPVIALLLLVMQAVIMRAQDSWKQLDGPYGGGDVLFFINAPNGDIFAATERDGIFRSIDEGKSWHSLNSDTKGLIPVLVTASGTIFAVSDDRGGIFRSTDGGTTWEQKANGIGDRHPGLMTITTDGTIFMAATEGVSRTTDNGENWSASGLDSVPSRFPVTGPDNALFVAAEDSGLYRSTDHGTTWQNVGSMQKHPLDGIVFRGSNELIAATDDGIFRSTDNGDSFQPFALPGREIGPLSLYATSSGELFTAVRDSNLYRISADGSVATPLGVSGLRAFSLTISRSGNIVAAYDGKGVFYSEDNGTTFKPVSFPAPLAVISLAESENEEILAGTSGAGLFRSSDGGTTWSDLNLPESYVAAIDRTPSGILFAAGQQGAAFRSTNRGTTWERLTIPVQTDIADLLVTGSGPVLIGSNDGIARSTDDGTTWNTVLPEEDITGLAEAPNGELWALNYQYLFRSTDNGASWMKVTVTPATFSMFRIAAPRNGVIVVGTHGSGSSASLLRTTNNGTSWDTAGVECPSAFDLQLTTDKEGNLYSATQCGVRYSTDGGATWSQLGSLPEDRYLGTMLVTRAGDLLMGTPRGIYMHAGPTPLSVKQALASTTVAGLSLRTAPNPAHDRTSISFHLSSRSYTDVTLFNLLGEHIATIYRGDLSAGDQLLDLNIGTKALEDGAYVVQLTANGRTATSILYIR